ncbi:hypothetical protein L873DRAFT_1829051 [Choiromyces venosus 120613-1]|uniref:BTB domain-containing protein n=1 Tax=Choiromyces venosus 120613-1 TaxID=1336337 RepID=A0A3N4JUH5_9PEZI|nr:hypothetical protein L873DRAFT_1829051 [Choiromyces venosus 120613-1]
MPPTMTASTSSITAPQQNSSSSNSNTPRSSTPTTTQPQVSQNFSSLVATILKTSGREPPPLVGSSTTIIGDTLYAFGGRLLSRTKPQLTCDMYALDLITRSWSKLETRGDIPRPRYFHSVCALGDTKLVCFGGMSPTATSPLQTNGTSNTNGNTTTSPGGDPQNEVMVMSDIHIYDIPSQTWTYIRTSNPPEGRYAHCATILPTSATFTSTNSVAAPVVGGLGLEGLGGAEMVIVGGQDSANHYIEEINVFNLRSLKWTSTTRLDRSCGAYRSVVAPLGRGLTASSIGAGRGSPYMGSEENPSFSAMNGQSTPQASPSEANAMLIYSNYNFLDVKLELQIRLLDGSLTERPMNGQFSPPGLRFPNGGVLDNHFVVSGTYLTSSKQEYALWALDLRTLIWSRIDAGQAFSQGSWNRGVLWSKRNAFLILGNKNRSLVEDYNHRRINFTNLCMVELEAFGLYENPRMNSHPALQRSCSVASQELGRMVLGMKEMADMEFLAVGGERVPVNSRIVARRWGPYFLGLLNASNKELPSPTGKNHNSASTITQQSLSQSPQKLEIQPPTTAQFNPLDRPRTLYLPHTLQTLVTLVHYLYTSTLPPPNHPQSSPQILCSLLQIARPYQVEGLLEAVVERLHQVLDGKNAAAVFNAAAMAAGGGNGGKREPVENLGGTGDGWRGGVSSVIGLQKRGLRGLMEGRRMRERGRSMGGSTGTGTASRSSEVPMNQGTFGVGVGAS